MITLQPQPLTAARFAPYGDVVEASSQCRAAMNEDRFERFDDLCNLETDGGRLAVSIARCRTATELPYVVDVVERHPLGSQAFIPLQRAPMLLVVAAAGDSADGENFEAFISNGSQGINYHKGTWHMPLIAFKAGNCFLIVDRVGEQANCDQHTLAEALLIEAL